MMDKGMVIDSVSISEYGIKWTHTQNKLRITADRTMTAGSGGILKINYHGIPADGLIISENKFGNRSFFL